MSGAPGPGPGRSPLPCAPRPAAVLQLGGGAEPARPGVAVIDLRFPRGAAADVSAAGGGTGAGDCLQELLHGLPERAGAAARPGRLPPLGDLPAGLLPDALPAHRGGLPELLLSPPPSGRHGRTVATASPTPLGAHLRTAPGLRGPDAPLCPHGSRGPVPTVPPLSVLLSSKGPRACPCPSQPRQPPQRDISLQLLPSGMLCDVDQVTAVRFILRQPSPVWLHFTIEELQIFPRGQKVSRCPCCPTTTRQEVQDRPPSPSPVPGIAPYSSRGFRHPPEDTGEWVQVLVLRWGTWGPLMCWGPGDRLLQPPPALPVLEVDVCLSSGTELEAAAPNYRLQTPNLNTKFPFSKAHLIPIPT
ncbi:nicolin-1 isoform 1-T1 [Alca torda]